MFSVPAPLITTLLFPRLARNGYLLVTFTLVFSSLCSYYLVMLIRFLSRRSLVRSSRDVFLFFPYCFFVLCHGFLRQICKRKGTNKVWWLLLLLLSRSPIMLFICCSIFFNDGLVLVFLSNSGIVVSYDFRKRQKQLAVYFSSCCYALLRFYCIPFHCSSMSLLLLFYSATFCTFLFCAMFCSLYILCFLFSIQSS